MCARFCDTTVRLSTEMEPISNTFNVQEFSSSELAKKGEIDNDARETELGVRLKQLHREKND